ncbi:nidogen-like domain-containing protein [Pseudoduganella violaceinigra]|uniref:nidogen-like domain-containing protein n=1 Tax=Pseudoduganella violaceinigra TaxID=246602 RepID=UPI0003F99552|nr:nidogen-like domain-containing protein [Pseudoduganella violaceinigra]
MTKLTSLICAALLACSATASASPILSGFKLTNVAAVDDGSTLVNLAGGMKLGLNGTIFSSLFVNTNGNVSFGSGMSLFSPTAFNGNAYSNSFLAPFFGDVDIRNGHGSIGYGNTQFDGHNAFAVTWDKVGYYGSNDDKRNTFQLMLVDRSDTGANNFDFYYNYGALTWDQGDKARAGFHMVGTAADFEFKGSGSPNKLLDAGSLALISGSNVGVVGRYAFNVRDGVAAYGMAAGDKVHGVPQPGSLALLGIGMLALALGRRRKA